MSPFEQVLIDMGIHAGSILGNSKTKWQEDLDSREVNQVIYLCAKEFVESVPVDTDDYLGKIDQFIEQRLLSTFAV